MSIEKWPGRLHRRGALGLAVAAWLGSAAFGANAAPYPERPITIIVGYSAGGANDVLARLYAEQLQKTLKQTVIVENRPGVASIVGAAAVAKAKPDGYTLFMGASGPLTFNYALYAKLPYAASDFVPISLTGTFPLVLLVNAQSPVTNVRELVDFSVKHPDTANYSASAASFQLMTELFKERTGAKFSHIPYKGSADSTAAVMSGDVTMTLVDAGPASTAVQGGRVKALAVTSAERMKEFPNIPTLKELGVDLTVTLWSGLLAPAGTPADVVSKLQQEIARASEAPDLKAKLATLAITPASSSSEALKQLISDETSRWQEVARKTGIKPQ